MKINQEYNYWDNVLAQHEKKVRERKMKWFENIPPQYQLDHLYKKGKLTEEQYEELTRRAKLYKEVKAFGLFAAMKAHKNDEFFKKYYYITEKRYANGKTYSEMCNN